VDASCYRNDGALNLSHFVIAAPAIIYDRFSTAGIKNARRYGGRVGDSHCVSILLREEISLNN